MILSGKSIKRLICIVLSAVMILFVPFEAQAADGLGPGAVFPLRYNEYPNTQVSTQTVFLNGIFFTVDCYHDRILYNDTPDIGVNLLNWKVMADDLNKPHAICSDGFIYLVADTDNNRVVTYARIPTGEFVELQSFPNIGIRPHYCEYDAATSSFYVWSSYTGEMYIFRRSANGLDVKLTSVKKLSFMAGLYTRSFTIDGNNILLCSQGAGGIIVVNKRTFRYVAAYPVAYELGGVVQISHIGNSYYLSTSSDVFGNQNAAKIVRSNSPAGFASSTTYVDVTEMLGGQTGLQVPYYISRAGDVYIARMTGMGAGLNDYACVFTEDALGNIIVGGRVP